MFDHFYPVIVAGGSGTRFWPLSRRQRPKQVLALDGADSDGTTMIQQTVARLSPLAPVGRFLVITGLEMAPAISEQLNLLGSDQILAEPAARNTAPAIGLAAYILLRQDPDAVLGMFPADHAIADAHVFRLEIERGLRIAQTDKNIVVLGIQPTRAETGYGYIEGGAELEPDLFRVRRFTEKPDSAKAETFIAAGNYYWNSGMFLWSARTLVDAIKEYLPKTSEALSEIAAAHGTLRFNERLQELYPQCDDISIDYALMEPRSQKGENDNGIFCIRATFGWNDLGSWAALHKHRTAAGAVDKDANVIESVDSYTLDAAGNFFHAPGKFIAAVGVEDLVVVETPDALLITTRQRSQDVGKIVQHLKESKRTKLI